MKESVEQPIVDVEEVYSKTEQYIEDNKNTLMYVVAGIVVVIGLYIGYTKFYLAPLEVEASNQIWKAEQYFEKDSFNLALNGDGNYYGFLEIIDSYGGTSVGNLANYYAGVSYLRLGQYDEAIEYLEDFDSGDPILGPVAIGAIGDAYMELGDVDSALKNYLAAAKKDKNNFSTPIYLMKAGMAYEELGDFKVAKELYERLKKDFPDTNEGRNIDKYIARADLLSKS